MNKLMLNNEWKEVFYGLPNEQAGVLIKALFACHEEKPVQINDPVLCAVFNMMADVVRRNREAYASKCKQNAANGSKGGKAKANASERKQTLANASERVANLANRKEKKGIEENIKENNKDIMSGKPDPVPKKKTDLMPAVSEIIAYLNDRAGTKYRVYSRSTQELIKGRLDERYTVEDFKRVIDNMAAQWKGDPKMEQYLRPETLFKRSHFESYLNTKPRQKNAAGQFSRFPQRNDAEHDDMVKRIIAMQ